MCYSDGVVAFNAVINGVPHNGLTFAAYFSHSGIGVKVVEWRWVVSGTAASGEFTSVLRILHIPTRCVCLTQKPLEMVSWPVTGLYCRADLVRTAQF